MTTNFKSIHLLNPTFHSNRCHTFIQFKETKVAFLVAIQIYTGGSTNKIMYRGKLH